MACRRASRWVRKWGATGENPSAHRAKLALVLVIKGLVLAVFADRLDVLLARLAEIPPEALRAAGLVSAVLGLFAVWLIRG